MLGPRHDVALVRAPIPRAVFGVVRLLFALRGPSMHTTTGLPWEKNPARDRPDRGATACPRQAQVLATWSCARIAAT
eukprot:4732436-Pyramimonas_sp.AAC.1